MVLAAQLSLPSRLLGEPPVLAMFDPNAEVTKLHTDALSRARASSTGGRELSFDVEFEDRWDVCVLLTIKNKL